MLCVCGHDTRISVLGPQCGCLMMWGTWVGSACVCIVFCLHGRVLCCVLEEGMRFCRMLGLHPVLQSCRVIHWSDTGLATSG